MRRERLSDQNIFMLASDAIFPSDIISWENNQLF